MANVLYHSVRILMLFALNSSILGREIVSMWADHQIKMQYFPYMGSQQRGATAHLTTFHPKSRAIPIFLIAGTRCLRFLSALDPLYIGSRLSKGVHLRESYSEL